MSLSKFMKDGSNEKKISELFEYLGDEKIIRVLLKNNIYELRDIQKEAVSKGLYFNKSFLVVAPSGSGKTLIGELCILNSVFRKYGKAVYLVPFKALASEKYIYFKKNYERFKIRTELSIGDIDVDDKELQKADIIITTYEKMDSILRNFKNKPWIHSISSIIIDEIHTVGEKDRGPRLESLIVRLNEFLINPQIIGLSATIANSKFFCDWLSTLGQNFILIESDKRPVPLKYDIITTKNKDLLIKKSIKTVLEKHGQVIVFVNRRKKAQQLAEYLKNTVKKKLNGKEISICKKLSGRLENIKGSIKGLSSCIKSGVIFHHAGLLPKERSIVEEYFNKRVIKVIVCTTTLSAGINTPARMVIVRDFKRYEIDGDKISDFSGLYESFSDRFSFFEPFSSNQIFQMLGRAGRPGLDEIGFGLILAKNFEEKEWINDHYFIRPSERRTVKLVPKYNPLNSAISSVNTLQEQVLLRIYENDEISINEIKKFFEKSYFWYCLKGKHVPIDQFLRIREIKPENVLKLHSNPKIIEKIKNNNFRQKIINIDRKSIHGLVQTESGVFDVTFDINSGTSCTCSFNNRTGDNLVKQNSYNFIFCDHISSFLFYLISKKNDGLKKYIDEIIPKSVKEQYILDYLIEKGLISKENNVLKCTTFGQLIIKLYLYPVSGIKIREILEAREITDYKSLIEAAFSVLKEEKKIRNYKMMKPLIWWAEEEPLQNILDEFKIFAGDLFSVKENITRIITFIGVIASFLDEDEITNSCETLSIRLNHGISEELFDLVLRLKNVGRVRARILYNAGYRTTPQVLDESAGVLHYKTGLSLKICQTIIKESRSKKEREKRPVFKPLEI